MGGRCTNESITATLANSVELPILREYSQWLYWITATSLKNQDYLCCTADSLLASVKQE